MQGKGEHAIVRKQVNAESTTAGKIYIPPSIANDAFFEGVIVHGGMYAEDYGLAIGDRVLIRNTINNIQIGKTKEGNVYAVEYEFILCSLESDDDATVYA